MNCESWQRNILLSESGELPAAEANALAKHLAACSDCRAFGESSRVLQRAVHQTALRRAPSTATLQAIRAEAVRQASAGTRILWQPVAAWAACAAALLIAVGAWWFAARQPDTYSVTLNHVHALAADITGGIVETGSAENGQPVTGEERLRRLAQQLLHMEGFVVEETTTADEIETVSPTVLLPRSTLGLESRRYG
jgi:anti-sigma factor RsiW